ncbi:MAG TPA: hypothetical protein G4O13_08360 [Dehalococcoidia bacterium]|nr:hypothetical protein [Dehalococcoidia bacterium]
MTKGKMVNQSTGVKKGSAFIEELCKRFPDIPRSIVIKSDVLRNGTRFTPLIHELGKQSFPHFLLWNPDHVWNPDIQGITKGELITVPWKFDLSDDTPVVIRFDRNSPYELVRHDDGHLFLHRDGEAIDEISVEPATEWLYKTTSSGTLMTSVFMSWTRQGLLACALRYCEYTKTGDTCVYCCLDSTVDEFKDFGPMASMSLSPKDAAETYRAAQEEVGFIKEASMTGGSLLDTAKEMERYIAIFGAMDKVRKEMGKPTWFSGCLTARPDLPLIRELKKAGMDSIAPNMDCWEDFLWPEIVPGKHKFVGRDYWIDSLQKCLEVFGKGNVGSVFVVGPEMSAASGFTKEEDGIASWRSCFEWLIERDIVPVTSQWQTEVGSPWSDRVPPSTDYFLSVGRELNRCMEESGMRKNQHHHPYKNSAWSTDADFRRLVTGCRCDGCLSSGQ